MKTLRIFALHIGGGWKSKFEPGTHCRLIQDYYNPNSMLIHIAQGCSVTLEWFRIDFRPDEDTKQVESGEQCRKWEFRPVAARLKLSHEVPFSWLLLLCRSVFRWRMTWIINGVPPTTLNTAEVRGITSPGLLFTSASGFRCTQEGSAFSNPYHTCLADFFRQVSSF